MLSYADNLYYKPGQKRVYAQLLIARELAIVDWKLENTERALQSLKQNIADSSSTYGIDSKETQAQETCMAYILVNTGRIAEGIVLLEKIIASQRQTTQMWSFYREIQSQRLLAFAYREKKDFRRAMAVLGQVSFAYFRTFGGQHPQVLDVLTEILAITMESGDLSVSVMAAQRTTDVIKSFNEGSLSENGLYARSAKYILESLSTELRLVGSISALNGSPVSSIMASDPQLQFHLSILRKPFEDSVLEFLFL